MDTLNIIKKDGYAIVQLNRGKVNAINFQMVKELIQTFQSLKEEVRQTWLKELGSNGEAEFNTLPDDR